MYAGDKLDDVTSATVNFSNNVTDPKAQIITSYIYNLGLVLLSPQLIELC